ncbi:hypothetical protein BDN67DRAFT_391828 [Paxillus ammoniavirescens]|nr:hypothetical protein BDN67DRAFT_391828 [Paxillus ammoniavirescens]
MVALGTHRPYDLPHAPIHPNKDQEHQTHHDSHNSKRRIPKHLIPAHHPWCLSHIRRTRPHAGGRSVPPISLGVVTPHPGPGRVPVTLLRWPAPAQFGTYDVVG